MTADMIADQFSVDRHLIGDFPEWAEANGFDFLDLEDEQGEIYGVKTNQEGILEALAKEGYLTNDEKAFVAKCKPKYIAFYWEY